MNVRHRPEICDRMKKVLPASTYLPCVEKESDFGRVIVGFAYLSYREKVTVFDGILDGAIQLSTFRSADRYRRYFHEWRERE